MSLVLTLRYGEELQVGEATLRIYPDAENERRSRVQVDAPKSVSVLRETAKKKEQP